MRAPGGIEEQAGMDSNAGRRRESGMLRKKEGGLHSRRTEVDLVLICERGKKKEPMGAAAAPSNE